MEYGNDFDFSYGVPDGPTMSSSGSDIFSVGDRGSRDDWYCEICI